MAPRTIAEAAADLRLDDTSFNADFQRIRSQLLARVSTLESDATISIGVDLDEDDLAEVAGQVSAFADNASVTANLGLDTDAAQDDLGQFQASVDGIRPVTVPVDVDQNAARAELEQFASSVDDQIAPQIQQAGESTGRTFGQGFSSALSGVLRTAAVAATGILATSLIGGFRRFTVIEDSTASLTVALGSATEAAETLDDVLNVVIGTPFNLDDFARAATNLISFGVEAQKVPGYLTAIGEAAATRGSQAAEFANRLSTIFGQISAIGRLNGEDVWRFADVGVDALKILGNSLDVTTAEVRKLISEGAIPAAGALDALAAGILDGSDGINGATNAFAGTMAQLRDTLAGSIGGFKAATDRFGVAIIDPLSDTLTDGFKGAIEVMNALNDRVRVVFDDLVQSSELEALRGFLQDLPNTIDPFLEKLAEIGPALAPIGVGIAGLGLGQLGAALGTFGNFIPGVTTLAGALTLATAAFAAFTPEIRDALLPVLETAGELVVQLGGASLKFLTEGLEDLTPVLVNVIDAFEDLLPLIASIVDAGSAILIGLTPALETLGFVLEKMPVEVLTALLAAFLGFKAVSGVSAALTGVSTALTNFGTRANAALVRTQGAFDETFRRGAGSLRSLQGVIGTTAAVVGAGFSGMALASEDAAISITGSIGAISSIALGVAQGGVFGGLAATAGAAAGFIAQDFIDAQREAKELEEAVASLADRIRSEFDDDPDLIDSSGVLRSRVFGDLLDAELDNEIKTTLDNLGITYQGLAGIVEQGGDQFDRWVENAIKAELAANTFVDGAAQASAAFRAQFDPTAEGLGFSDQFFYGLDLSEANQQQDLIDDIATKWQDLVAAVNLVNPAIDQARVDARLLADEVVDGMGDAGESTDEFKRRVAGTVSEFDAAAFAASVFGAEAVTAAEQATEALGLYNDELDKLRGKLDLDIQIQNLEKELADLGVSLTSIINEDDIRAADSIREDIGQSRERIADLRVRLAEENAEGAVLAADLQRRIDEADAAGAVQGAAALRQQLALIGSDAAETRRDIDSELARIAELESRLSQLATDPITLIQAVRQQAADADLTLFEFLLEAPTTEAQQAFQDDIAGVINEGLATASEIGEKEGAAAGAIAAQEFVKNFRASLIAGDVDPGTADQIIDRYLDLDAFNERAVQAAIAGILGLNETLRTAEPGQFGIETDIAAAEQQLADLREFVETPGVTLPAELDLDQLETDLGVASLFALDPIQAQIDLDEVYAQLGLLPSPTLEDNILEFAASMDTTGIDEAIGVYAPPSFTVPVEADLTELDATLGAYIPQPYVVAFDADVAAAEATLTDYPWPERLLGFGADTSDVDATIEDYEPPSVHVPLEVDLEHQLNDVLFEHTVPPLILPIQADTTQATNDLLALAEQANAFGFVPLAPIDQRLFFREGGIHFPEKHEAHIATTMRTFAEEEPWGEGYIPLAPHKRPRSLDVMREIGDILQVDVIDRRRPGAVPQVLQPTSQATPSRVLDAVKTYDHSVNVHGDIIVKTPTQRRIGRSIVDNLASLSLRGFASRSGGG